MEYEYLVQRYEPEMMGDNLSQAIEKGMNGMAKAGWEPIFVNTPTVHGAWVTFRRAKK